MNAAWRANDEHSYLGLASGAHQERRTASTRRVRLPTKKGTEGLNGLAPLVRVP